MRPFKLGSEYRKSSVLFEVADEFFGKPVSWSVGDVSKKEWNFDAGTEYYFLEVEHRDGAEIPSINITAERMEYPGRRYSGFPDKLSEFINKVRKPWDEWTEEELLSDPMWIYFLSQDSYVSEALHTAMVMWSYESLENQWIKRYFKECPRSLPRSQEGSRLVPTTPSSMQETF
jgi:hypothetical protein